MRSAIRKWIGFVLLIATISAAQAQSNPASYPSQVVRIVVPVSPGSIADGFARIIAKADAAGMVLGARVPIILTSRADSVRSRLASCAVAVLYAYARGKASSLQAA